MTKKEKGEIASHHRIREFNLANQTTPRPKAGSGSLYVNLMIGSESRFTIEPFKVIERPEGAPRHGLTAESSCLEE